MLVSLVYSWGTQTWKCFLTYSRFIAGPLLLTWSLPSNFSISFASTCIFLTFFLPFWAFFKSTQSRPEMLEILLSSWAACNQWLRKEWIQIFHISHLSRDITLAARFPWKRQAPVSHGDNLQHHTLFPGCLSFPNSGPQFARISWDHLINILFVLGCTSD